MVKSLFSAKPRTFELQVQTMTLRVTSPEPHEEEARAAALAFWEQLHSYAARDPRFERSKRPVAVPEDAPEIVRRLASIAAKAGVGPMFAMQGALCDHVGRFLLKVDPEVRVACGADQFVASQQRTKFTVVQGEAEGEGVSLVIDPARGAQGVSTASGMDALPGDIDGLAVVATSCAVASSTVAGVLAILDKPKGVPNALRHLARMPGVLGGVIVRGELIGVTGAVELAD